MSCTPVEVSEELFAAGVDALEGAGLALREHVDHTQLVEGQGIALEDLRGRFDPALGIGAAGFSAGFLSAVPACPPTGQDQP
jgi:hypothetical protein